MIDHSHEPKSAGGNVELESGNQVAVDVAKEEAFFWSLTTIVAIILYVVFFQTFTVQSINQDLSKAGVFAELRAQGYRTMKLREFGWDVERTDRSLASKKVCGALSIIGCSGAPHEFEADLIDEEIHFSFFSWYFDAIPAAPKIKEELVYAASIQWQWDNTSVMIWSHIKNHWLRVVALIIGVVSLFFVVRAIFERAFRYLGVDSGAKDRYNANRA